MSAPTSTEDPSIPFDPTVALPAGVTVLEASAGTGKTHTVASLVVAEVAEGRPLDELLVVTFTRKATGTLRERVWQRLADSARALDPALPTAARTPSDELLVHLRRGSEADVAARRVNLERAVSDFDAATIATTHGFVQQVLAGLGVMGDADRDLEVVDRVSDLVDEAVDDLFVRRFHGGGPVLFRRKDALTIANAVVDNPEAAIAAVDNSEGARLRRRFASTLRERIAEQKRRGRLVTYDDLLTRLASSLDDEVTGEIVAERLRRRYSMAIVDEFQDTDTVQWRILRAAFASGPCRLVLVGDPKQAVYAFRGGDVYAYLRATEGAARRTLDVSWRSDQPLLDGLDAFFAGAQLGAPTIRHRPLQARPGAEQRRLLGPAPGAPFTVRIVDRQEAKAAGAIKITRNGSAEKPSTRSFIAEDLAIEVARLLSNGTTVVERGADGSPEGERPLRAGDIAVLVRRHRDGETVRDALHQARVPAVVHGGAGVFATASAGDWLELLRALEQPSNMTRVRAVALGPFFGWDATRLGTATEDDWDHIDECLHEWLVAWRGHGVAGLLRRAEAAEGLTARLLSTAGGERALSDLRHVAELLDAWQTAHPASMAVLVGWLSQRIAEAARDEEAARRRLETDADAVAVHTIHGAKGLEFPVVMLPSMWEGPWTPDDAIPVFHDEHGERCLGVGGVGAVHRHQLDLAERERDEEELRLLYVALTRARHRVVVWWATASDARTSPFARVLLGRDAATGAVEQWLQRPPSEDDIRTALSALTLGAGGAIAVEDADGPLRRVAPPVAPDRDGDHPPRQEPGQDHLGVSTFGRDFDRAWVRTSYSGLTAAAHDAGPTLTLEVVEVDENAKVDEPDVDAVLAAPPEDPTHPLAATLPLGDLPGGARVGSMVHELLELTDFAAADLAGELAAAAHGANARRLVDGHVDALLAGLALALQTPLGPTFDGGCLRDLDARNRLDELAFDLPLAGGDEPRGHVTMAAIAARFAALPADDPLLGYHERLGDPVLAASLRGFLTGSIDLVARVGERHVVIDYKTNRLAPSTETLTAWHYRPAGLAAAMQDAHYPLQAALYSVALHRYLRWRVPDYAPERHLGGVAYLFLRGMSGPDVPLVDGEPCGVFTWRPPTSFVTGLSDLLDRGDAADDRGVA